MNPPILVLDDATSAIDVQVEQEIHVALRRLMRGRTTLIVAHRLSTISLADRVLLMEDGRLVADGTHASLLRTEPRYAEVLAQAEEHEREVGVAGERSERPARAERGRRPWLIGDASESDLVDGRDPAPIERWGG